MYVTYRPEDGDAQEWEFDPDRVRQSEGELIEKRFGGTYDEWKAALLQGGLRARRVLLWHLTRLAHPHLRYEDTPDFLVGEFLVEMGVAELREIRDRIEKTDLDDETRAQVMAGLDIALSDAIAREDAQGKALSATATSSADAASTPA